jgi:hypothetical protein
MAFLSREMYIPKGATKVEDEATGAVAYYISEGNSHIALGFKGRASKPSFHYRFQSREKMDKYIADFFSNVRAQKEAAVARRKERYAPHNVVVGDIFGCSWGWEQTNVDWYQVVDVRGKNSVYVRQIKGSTRESGFMSGYSSPIPNAFIDDTVIMCRVNMQNGTPCIKIKGHYAFRGTEPRYVSWYA